MGTQGWFGLPSPTRQTIFPLAGSRTASMDSFHCDTTGLLGERAEICVELREADTSQFQSVPAASKLPSKPAIYRRKIRLFHAPMSVKSPLHVPMAKLVRPRAVIRVRTASGMKALSFLMVMLPRRKYGT